MLDHHDRPDSTTSHGPSLGTVVVVAAAAGLAVGVFTAYGQGWLGDTTASLVNSAGPWSLAAFVVARLNRGALAGIAAATVTLMCCELGYVLATEVRGGSNATSTIVFWLTAAVLAGPPIGLAGVWSAGHGLRRWIGFGVLGGILVGEAWYGWTTVADTTDWRYWAVELGIGLAVVVAAASRARRDGPIHVMSAVAAATLTAVVVFTVARSV